MSPETPDTLFGQEISANLAAEARNYVSIPFVPGPVIEYILTQAIQKMSSDLSPGLLEQVQEFMATSSTETDFDNFSPDEVRLLADRVAEELNPLIDAPILTEEQELLVLREAVKVVFDMLTTSDQARRQILVDNEIKLSQNLFGTKETRQKLAQMVNEAVNIPLVDEQQEEIILLAGIEACAETLQKMLPRELINTLKGEHPDSVTAVKDMLVHRVNEKVDLVGFNEEQEEALIEAVVSLLFEQCIDGTELEFLVLSPDERVERLQEKITLLEREIIMCERRYERERRNLYDQLHQLQTRLHETQEHLK